MHGSYNLRSFTDNREAEAKRLEAQVVLFFKKEFEVYTRVGLRDGMNIIECGAGPGALIRNIVQKLPHVKATALEIDDYLFSVLEENSLIDGNKIFETVQASIYDTRLPDDSFDFVITRLVVEHLQEPLKAMYELNRILKPGGRLMVVSNDFEYHLLTYPVIPELDEMYRAYCNSRFSEGGNPMIGRQLPVYFHYSNFNNVDFNVVVSHSHLLGDKSFLNAENVNISKSLVKEGYFDKDSLANLVDKWVKLLEVDGHVFYRQLMMVSGEKKQENLEFEYNESLESRLRAANPLGTTNNRKTLNSEKQQLFQQLMSGKTINNKAEPGISRSDFSTSENAITLSKDSVKTKDISNEDLRKEILELYKQLLNNNKVSLTDNFFEVGGDSVLIPEIVDKLNIQLGISIRILDIFEYPTVEQLASYIESNCKDYEQ